MPTSLFMRIWDPIIILALFYTATVVPYQVAFLKTVDQTEASDIVNLLVDISFILDLFITFLVPYQKLDRTYEKNHKKIAYNYFKSTFIIDLFACLPSEFFEMFIQEQQSDLTTASSGDNKLLRLARIQRLYRIVRIIRVVKVLKALKFIKFIQ